MSPLPSDINTHFATNYRSTRKDTQQERSDQLNGHFFIFIDCIVSKITPT